MIGTEEFSLDLGQILGSDAASRVADFYLNVVFIGLHCLNSDQSAFFRIFDGVALISKDMHDAQVIAFATPIYYYEMSGQMKTLLDRANWLYSSDYKFEDIYLLSTAAEDEDYVDKRAISGLEGWIDCFEKARLAGKVFAGGVNDAGEIVGHTGLEKAYELGKAI